MAALVAGLARVARVLLVVALLARVGDTARGARRPAARLVLRGAALAAPRLDDAPGPPRWAAAGRARPAARESLRGGFDVWGDGDADDADGGEAVADGRGGMRASCWPACAHPAHAASRARAPRVAARRQATDGPPATCMTPPRCSERARGTRGGAKSGGGCRILQGGGWGWRGRGWRRARQPANRGARGLRGGSRIRERVRG